jgi:predicted metal-dependent hydrolase
MSTKQEVLSIANIEVDVVRKDIKNMHLAVYPPSGRVRLSAPLKTDLEVVRLFAISKLGWIKKHIKNFKAQPRETKRIFKSGESHFFRGKRYVLEVKEGAPKNYVELDVKKIHLFIKEDVSVEKRELILREWYRKQLKQILPELIQKWEKVIGVEADEWAVKLMRTKWGACNIEEKRIWLNLELAKKPTICLEYIIVHELVHLLERNHNDRFIHHMNTFMPKWRFHRDELNKLPVAHTDWGY